MTMVAASEALFVRARGIDERVEQAHDRLQHLGTIGVEEVGLAIVGTDFVSTPEARGARAGWGPTEQFTYLLADYAAEIGLNVMLGTDERPQAVQDLIEYHNRRQSTFGIVGSYPFSGYPEGTTNPYAQTEAILGSITAEKNVDGLGPNAQKLTATAEAMIVRAFDAGRPRLPVVVLGDGRVARGSKRGLREQFDIEPIEPLEDRKYAALRAANTILTVVGVGESLTPDMISDAPIMLVDGGKGKRLSDGKIVNDAHPDTVRKVLKNGGMAVSSGQIGQTAREIITVRTVDAAWRSAGLPNTAPLLRRTV